jgi:BlaI family transcriptional regulator, penicillinase repressor
MENKSHHLGDLQYEIMRVLWERGESTATGVLEGLSEEHRRAPTTIATMLSKMERKGVVRHRVEGRVFVYRPAVSREDVHRTMVGDLMERLFAGDVTALVSHLLEEGDVDRGELSRLSRLIEDHKSAEAKRKERGRGR